MSKVKNFFSAIGQWCKKTAISIGRWFKSLFVPMNDKEPKLLTAVKSEGTRSVLASVMAALLGIFVGFIIMLAAAPSRAASGLVMLLAGGFNGGIKGIGDVLYYATPIIMTGLSVGFAFKTGLFNIGASGQYTMGMFMSLLTAHSLKGVVTSNILWVICLIAGILGGALWGVIPGIFKAFFNVNEVIICIMTNYIGMYFVDMIIKNTPDFLYDSVKNWTLIMPSNSDLPRLGLDKLFGGSYVNIGIIFAIIIAIVIYILLNKTTFGYELKACGQNKHSAKYAGINEKRNIIMSMVIAGALAGIGGAFSQQAGLNGTYTPNNTIASEGFNGIAVALLGASNPIGIIFAGIFFAHLKQGGFYMQVLGIKNEIIDVIIGVTIYFAALTIFFKGLIQKIMTNKKDKQAKQKNASDDDTDGTEDVKDSSAKMTVAQEEK